MNTPDLAAPAVADLSMNETPYPPLPSVREVVMAGVEHLHRYPDHVAGGLVAALAQRHGVPQSAILVGPGSAGLCQHLIAALGLSRGEVVHPALSFEAYPLLIANAGARPVAVALAGDRHDLAAMAAAVTTNTRCVLLCSPNNPTGAALHREELDEFFDQIPVDVPVILDEAYREFVTDPAVPAGLDLFRSRENVCLLRTFSKAYGLAALRVGYAVVPPHLAAAARMMGMVFFPGSLGQAAAIESLGPVADAELATRCAELVAARHDLRAALLAMGLAVAPSEANFLWLALADAAESFALRCRQAGVLVRAYPGQGVRVTVGTPAANERLCTIARAFLAEDGWRERGPAGEGA